jgi:hypothetical protein
VVNARSINGKVHDVKPPLGGYDLLKDQNGTKNVVEVAVSVDPITSCCEALVSGKNCKKFLSGDVRGFKNEIAKLKLAFEKRNSDDGVDKDDQSANQDSVGDSWQCGEKRANSEFEALALGDHS